MLDQSSPLLHSTFGVEDKNSFALKRLRCALIECELQPGVSVSEAELASRFGLGRAAIRIALPQLAADSLISASPRNGWLVAPITGSSIGDVVSARLMLEPQLVHASFAQADIATLHQLAAQHAALSSREEVEAVAAARIIDRNILMQIAAGGGEIVVKWMGEILDRSARLLAYFEGGKISYVANSREDLVEALERNDVVAAGQMLKEEAMRFKAYLVEHLLSSGSIRSVDPEVVTASSSPRHISVQTLLTEKYKIE